MKSMQGYFDGNVCIPIEPQLSFEKDEPVIISKSNVSILDSFFGILDNESATSARQALSDCRSIKDGDLRLFASTS